jgi:hypothetical protein
LVLCAIATERYLYWTVGSDSGAGSDNAKDGKIQRATLDGENVEDLVVGLISPSFLALGP